MTPSAAMSRLSSLGALVCLASGLAWQPGTASEPVPRPDTGTVADGTYINKYFDLSYRLMPEWTEGLEGPEPSYSGYYVLKTLIPSGEFNGMILIAAQDLFFAPQAFGSAMDMAADLGRAKSEIEGTTIDRQPSAETIEAIHRVMRANGVTPPPPTPRSAIPSGYDYEEKKSADKKKDK